MVTEARSPLRMCQAALSRRVGAEQRVTAQVMPAALAGVNLKEF
jgi:hypothetical protein